MGKSRYTVEVRPATVLTTSGDFRGFVRGVVIFTADDGTREVAWSSALYSNERAARLRASKPRRDCESYLARTGKRWEIDEAESAVEQAADGKMATLRAERITARKKDMAALVDRLQGVDDAEVRRALPGVVGDALMALIREARDIRASFDTTDAEREDAKQRLLRQYEMLRRHGAKKKG